MITAATKNKAVTRNASHFRRYYHRAEVEPKSSQQQPRKRKPGWTITSPAPRQLRDEEEDEIQPEEDGFHGFDDLQPHQRPEADGDAQERHHEEEEEREEEAAHPLEGGEEEEAVHPPEGEGKRVRIQSKRLDGYAVSIPKRKTNKKRATQVRD